MAMQHPGSTASSIQRCSGSCMPRRLERLWYSGRCQHALGSAHRGQHQRWPHASRHVVVTAAKQMLVHVPPHPLVGHWLAMLRSEMTPTPVFRSAMAELGRLLVYEAARDWLPTMELELQTPVGPADGTIVDVRRPVKVVPILRAGLVPLEQIATVLPAYETYHVGLVRDEQTLQASWYLNKLPESFAPDDRVLISDPMMATGGTMVKVLDEVVARGASPEYIRVLSITVAPPALKQLSEKYPGLKVYTATIDAEINDQGYIVPGLGDAGDRAFGT